MFCMRNVSRIRSMNIIRSLGDNNKVTTLFSSQNLFHTSNKYNGDRLADFRKRFAALDLHNQSVEVNLPPHEKKRDDETLPRRHAAFHDDLLTHVYDDVYTLHSGFERSALAKPNQDCLGSYDAASGSFAYRTYEEVRSDVSLIARALHELGVKRQEHIGLFSRNRYEWIVAELGMFRQSFVPVALYDTLGHESIAYVINHAELRILLCGRDKLNEAVQVIDECPTLKHVIVFGDANQELPSHERVRFHHWSNLLGEATNEKKVIAADPPKPDDRALIMYTSGTTGTPKGVLHTHKAMVSAIAALTAVANLGENECYMSYLPLAHIFERIAVSSMLHHSSTIGFFRGDLTKLLDDIQLVAPTLLVGVPRVWERIEDVVNNRQSGARKVLYEKTLDSLYNAMENGRKPPFWTKIVTNKARASLGGRTRLLVSGSAPLSANTHRWVKAMFQTPTVQGYGLTETCAATTIGDERDAAFGHVGVPVPCVELKLRAVPDMGYVKPEEDGGELYVRGHCVTTGYYKQEQETKKTIDSDGWFATGDICRWTSDGTIQIIDRKKNIFKTSLGEYIQAEKIETICKKSRFCAYVFIYGDPMTPFLLCAVSVDMDYCKQWADSNNVDITDLSDEEIVRVKAINDAVLSDLRTIGSDAGLKGFELPKGVVLDNVEWTVDNKMLTPSFKIKRHELEVKYADAFDEMYATFIPDYEKPQRHAHGKK